MKPIVLAIDVAMFGTNNVVRQVPAKADTTLRLQCTRSAADHLKIVLD
jgi:hypothetical protein